METNIKWTIETYAAHNEALREAENKFQKERDRRYKEVAKGKEKAYIRAEQLSRETQTYKDMKANELREQLKHEREEYARASEVKVLRETMQPLIEFMAAKGGGEKAVDKTMYYVIAIGGIIVGLLISFLKLNL